jgi:hypothetical protein
MMFGIYCLIDWVKMVADEVNMSRNVTPAQLPMRLRHLLVSLKKGFVSRYNSLPRTQTTFVIASSFTFLLILVTVSANTRAIISPFHHLNMFWLLLALIIYTIAFYNAKTISSQPSFTRFGTAVVASLLVLYSFMLFQPSSPLFMRDEFMAPVGVLSLFFISALAGVLCGDLAQSDTLGDTFFIHHVLPKLRSNNPSVGFLLWGEDGSRKFIESKAININWNSKRQCLELNKLPLKLYAPVFMQKKRITSALELCKNIIEELPKSRRDAMKHYVEDFDRGCERLEFLYLIHQLGFYEPHLLSRPSHLIHLHGTKMLPDLSNYTITWNIPSGNWISQNSDSRYALHQALAPNVGHAKSRNQIKEMEEAIIQQIWPEFSSVSVSRAVNFHRSTINLTLVLRGGSLNIDSIADSFRMGVLKQVINWTLDFRKDTPVYPKTSAEPKFLSIDHWNQILIQIHKEPVSFMMRLYNQLNELIDDYPDQTEFIQRVEDIIEKGLKIVRLRLEQPVVGSNPSEVQSNSIRWLDRGRNDKKTSLHTVILTWVLFCSTFWTIEELPL